MAFLVLGLSSLFLCKLLFQKSTLFPIFFSLNHSKGVDSCKVVELLGYEENFLIGIGNFLAGFFLLPLYFSQIIQHQQYNFFAVY